MGQALYRTHRPLKFAEVVGQEHVTTALAHALAAGTISHAYLFTGPRGTGKTSIARILAHEINGLPYDDERMHLDIIEIDAASNRRIDEIRDLRDKVHIAPASAKYKVYIIDEVHMLTREAFNALLKTLEEPPAHAVFILATTEVHKLPETIISRTQRYTFKPVPLAKVAEHLQSIAKQEQIEIEPEALELVAAHGEGSFRDSISLLDQVRNSGQKVTLADVQAALGVAPAALIDALTTALQARDVVTVAEQLQQARMLGYEAARLAKQLGERLRAQVLAQEGGRAAILAVLAKLVEVPASIDPAAYLEIILLDAALAGSEAGTSDAQPPPPSRGSTHKPAGKDKDTVSNVAAPAAPSVSEPATRGKKDSAQAKPTAPRAHASPASSELPKAASAQPAESAEAQPGLAGGGALDLTAWQQALGQIRKNYSTLYSILKSAQVEFQPGLVRLKFTHTFHQKRAHDAKNRELIAKTIEAVSGQHHAIECVVAESAEAQPETAEPPAATISLEVRPTADQTIAALSAADSAEPLPEPPDTPPPASGSDSLDTISNIFGGAELLQS